MDVTTVKTEIKAWEREFRAQNGRNATIEDMKALPNIAEKYKLYKKLTKESDTKARNTPASRTQASEPPKTPPRAEPKHKAPSNANPAAIFSKPRPVAPIVDEATHNPFSPTKKRASAAGPSASTSTTNPFLTPVKPRRTKTRTPSPDPFPPVSAPAPALAPAAYHDPVVAKPHKRLRGDPVSPSPQPRDKRRRLANSKDTNPPSHGRSSQSRSISPPPVEEGDSFVDDSPVKAPVGGKAFKPLFEEANPPITMPLSQPTKQKGTNTAIPTKPFSRAKTLPGGIFGGTNKVAKDIRAGSGPANRKDIFRSETMEVDEDSNLSVEGKGKGKEKERLLDGAQKVKTRRALPGPKGLIPGKDDLFEAPPPVVSKSSSKAIRKRTLSEVTKDGDHATANKWDLLPPSPPPQQEGDRWYNGKGKGKSRGMAQQRSKKAKVSPAESDEDMEDETSSSESAEVKIVSWRGRPCSPQTRDEEESALILDPELQFHLHGRQVEARAKSASPRLEKFEVDLPEEMRRVLALSPRDWEREREEQDLVKGLMKGRRKAGGEVWGPGEIGGEEGSDEGEAKGVGEEDWEGEGAPWEVAEL